MKAIRIILSVAFFIMFWQIIVVGFNLPPYILPTPFLVFVSFKTNLVLLLQESLPTFVEAGVGLILSIFLGAVWALVLVYSKKLRLWLLPLLLISQALPVFVLAPLLVMWLGYGMVSKIAVTCLMIFFPIASSFYGGLSCTPKCYLDLAKTMNGKSWQILLRIRMPAALGSFRNGLKIAATFAPMGAIIGEWVGSNSGLGFLILNANSRLQTDLMFAAILVLVILTLSFYFLIDFLLRESAV